ncbi:GH92 family glycosyl hydrolase [Mucilaginibacter sp. SMC90]|uniref:GH92 family glycosyl hydrolase n=1 Tax=Mucilaginibacter sp. SMC90 TaxID=2929803 RepID=UPI001FB31CFD|nr:GH92 family glycosyl hydrolase [Mucilaginibacter sp. SMC90]UOE51293.1 GH92 family glycosyl hydrolase [Mucilaginibacter sp. SMC90]
MKKIFCFVLTLMLLSGTNLFAQQPGHLHYVDPFIGTTVSNVLTKWGNNGGCYPGAVAPSGSVQLSPETRVTGARGYNYTDSSVYYFSCLGHMSGFPEGSSGHLFIMPWNSDIDFEPGKSSIHFSHKKESAVPGYYKVSFEGQQTAVEATATTRTGMFRFTFSGDAKPQIFIGNGGQVNAISNKVLHVSDANTVINFSEGYVDKKEVRGGWLFTLPKASTGATVVTLQLSKSSVGYSGAQHNIDQEIGRLSFDEVSAKTSREWAKLLSVADITDNSEQNKTVFYTALYHSLLLPWVIDDADGNYRGHDGKVYQKTGQNQYGAFSPWDTFRSLHPLLTLLYPQKQQDVILSMLDVYKQSGHLPTETMTGNHAVPIIVDSYLKGITGFDKELAYKAMEKDLVNGPFIQPDMEVYHEKGYVPFTRPESVTRTVEYAYDDWALSQFADKVMNDKKAAQLLSGRGLNYRNLLNKDELFMLPRNGNEFKRQPGTSGYKEGDKWVYSYFVPQNGKDLINMTGGNEQFTVLLDSALSNDVILFDNETVFNLPYLFNQAGKPQLTQKWVRDIMLNRFSSTPGGLPGNDDLGSTSSWYIFSSMGIYSVCPGRPLYAIGAPLFKSVTLHLPNGKRFIISSNNSSAKNNYVQSLRINGRPWQRLTLPHYVLENGGTMDFGMGKEPANWPADKDPIELSTTQKNATFSIVNYSIDKKSVTSDERLVIKFKLKNAGSIGVKTVKLLANGKLCGYKNCLIEPGQTVQDSIAFRLYPVGKIVLKLDNMPPFAVEVTLPKKAHEHSFKISGLEVNPMIRLNENQEIKYQIKNIGGLKQTFTIPVIQNDSVAFTDNIKLNAGEVKTVSHNIKSLKKGFKYVRVDTAKILYKVYENSIESLLLNFESITPGKSVPDSSGFHNDGNIISASAIIGKDKLLFGDSTYVEVPNSPALDKMGESISMTGWVYPMGKERGLVDIISKGDNHVLQMTDSKILTFFAGGWGRGDCTVNLPADWQQHWHHIAGVCSGKTLYVYIDGALAGTSILEVAADLSVSNKWTLGRNEEFPSERVFHGYINKVKVFKAALSAGDIKAIVATESE